MSDDVAIKVEDLSKLYKIGARQAAYKTLRESIMGALTAPLRQPKVYARRVALSFEPSDDYTSTPKKISFNSTDGSMSALIPVF